MDMKKLIEYLKLAKNKRGLYIIKPKDDKLLLQICEKLGYQYTSDIAYIGKAEKTKSSCLYRRAKQEMGWSNFEGATFVRKIGLFLDFDVKNKTDKNLKELTKNFIVENFTIECIFIDDKLILSEVEKDFIQKHKPCLNINLKN